jgi:hypothetical protein
VQPLGSLQAIYGTRRFITEFTRALHLYLSWARPIQSTTLSPISKRSILILSTYVLVFLVVSFPLVFLPITYMRSAFLFSPFALHAPLTSSSSTSIYTWRRVQIMQLLIMQFSSPCRHSIPLRSKYSPQYPVLKH